MVLEKQPFVNYKLQEERKKDKGEAFTIWISSSEREWLNDMKKRINQPKDSTAIKQLAKIGAFLIGRPEMTFTIDTLFKNKRKNERIGIHEIE